MDKKLSKLLKAQVKCILLESSAEISEMIESDFLTGLVINEARDLDESPKIVFDYLKKICTTDNKLNSELLGNYIVCLIQYAVQSKCLVPHVEYMDEEEEYFDREIGRGKKYELAANPDTCGCDNIMFQIKDDIGNGKTLIFLSTN